MTALTGLVTTSGLSQVYPSTIPTSIPVLTTEGGSGVSNTATDGQMLIGKTASGAFVAVTPTTDNNLRYTGAAASGTFASPYGTRKLLAKGIGLALNSSSDQALTMAVNLTKYIVRSVIATNASGTPALAAGGVYTAASKGGSALVGTGQVYTALTATTKFIDLTIATIGTTDVVTSAQLYLSLTVTNAAAVTVDLYIYGDDLGNS